MEDRRLDLAEQSERAMMARCRFVREHKSQRAELGLRYRGSTPRNEA